MLYVAMAGAHQIWVHPLGGDSIQVFAGTGREDVIDGSREDAAFAQPSGLASDGRFLFVADSEGSAIRRIPLDRSGLVDTVAGTSDLEGGRSLFAFGDVDARGSAARLQHPLGLACASGRLFVADTYNHKIKVVDPATGAVETLLGTGKRGDSLQPAEFAEPGGISVAAGNLYIADTNNQTIKVADTLGRNVQTLEIEGLSSPTRAREPAADEFAPKGTAPATLPAVQVAAGDALRLDFSFKLPAGYKLNKEAPITCRLRAAEPTDLLAANQLSKRHPVRLDGEGKASASIPAALKSGRALLEVALSFTYCRDGVGGLCKLGSGRWTVPIEVSASGGEPAVQLTADVATN
jgi:hypothetical protein